MEWGWHEYQGGSLDELGLMRMLRSIEGVVLTESTTNPQHIQVNTDRRLIRSGIAESPPIDACGDDHG